MKKKLLMLIYFLLTMGNLFCQCNSYQVYESFGTTTLPTQGGTWSQNSVITLTSPVRTGGRSIGFNGSGDWIRTPQIASPAVFSFWYRRSTNTAAWSCVIETSPNGTTWTSRGTLSAITATYQQYSINLTSLALSNVYIRVRDTRSSGAQERYIDDMSWTSTNSTQNTLFPITSNCSQSVSSTITIIDQGSYAETYGNNLSQTVTFTVSDPTKLLELNISSLNIETDYDYLYIYDGPTTSSPLLATLTGTSTNLSYSTSQSNSSITIRFTTDFSNIGTWNGFQATVSQVLALPVELLYFEGYTSNSSNIIKWSTASEWNSSHFTIQNSSDVQIWNDITTINAAGNSNSKLSYNTVDLNPENRINYYRLIQYDFDGNYKIYGPIVLDNKAKSIKVVRIINLLGKEAMTDETGILIEVYEDGSIKKIIR
jgi:hypothetical protein